MCLGQKKSSMTETTKSIGEMKHNHKQYWLVLFTATSWREFMNAGGKTIGFNSNKLAAASKINKETDLFATSLK